MKALRILGTRGVPAAHGGFETFAEHLALHLVARGWRVTVYGQDTGRGPWVEDLWEGVNRVRIPIAAGGPRGTMLFDWQAIGHAARAGELCLTLGYNTAVFCARLRLAGVPNIVNMDGIEWRRAKWGKGARAWLWINDWAGCWLADHLVADHPEIARHLETRVRQSKVTTIAYGADRLPKPGLGSEADVSREAVARLGLVPGRYLTVIARPEPENSILEVVAGFSRRPRGLQLAVLGKYEALHPYHRKVQAAAGTEVSFLGAIYDKPLLQALRVHSAAYVHGHQVGGTNPSLVEALGAGNPVLAHDNRFNRWVLEGQDTVCWPTPARPALYFSSEDSFSQVMDRLVAQPQQLEPMADASRARHQAAFSWHKILSMYEALLQSWVDRHPRQN